MAEVLLVRHARSLWNEQGRWQGHADPPLAAGAEGEVTLAARRVGPFDLVACSDLVRARRTAELLAGDAPLVVDPGLREYDVGAWSGLTRAEIEAVWPEELALFDAGRLVVPPGGESRGDFEARVGEAGLRLAALTGRRRAARVLAVAHGGVVRALAARPERPVGHLCGYRAAVVRGRLVVCGEVDLAGRDGHLLFPEAVRSEP